MGTPRTMRLARWKREANSLIFSHVAVSTAVIGSPETPLYLALIASASNSGSYALTSGALAGGLQDELRDFIRLRDKRQVTRFNLYGLGSHALGHESLEVRIDRAVLG